MNNFRKLFQKLTGYWIHKAATLPIGVDVFYDIKFRIGFNKMDIVFDVGANEGQTLKWIRHYVPKAYVYCFEPVSSVCSLLRKNADIVGRCTIEQLALGETEDVMTIRLFDKYSVLNSLKKELMNQNELAKEEIINITKLDDYCDKNSIPRIDLLKIDTEGYELNVLAGAERMLKEKRIDFILSETGFLRSNKRNTNFSELSEYLSSRGYCFYAFYQMSDCDWRTGSNFGNALFIRGDIP